METTYKNIADENGIVTSQILDKIKWKPSMFFSTMTAHFEEGKFSFLFLETHYDDYEFATVSELSGTKELYQRLINFKKVFNGHSMIKFKINHMIVTSIYVIDELLRLLTEFLHYMGEKTDDSIQIEPIGGFPKIAKIFLGVFGVMAVLYIILQHIQNFLK